MSALGFGGYITSILTYSSLGHIEECTTAALYNSSPVEHYLIVVVYCVHRWNRAYCGKVHMQT